MSWDIFVQDFPADTRSYDDIPESFQPQPIGNRSEIIQKIQAILPTTNFTDPAWGIIDGKDFSIEINLGQGETLDGFAFHVRGGDGAVGVIALLLKHLGLKAIDSSTGDFFDAETALGSLQSWRAFRDQVIASLRDDQQ